jgi:hydroxymethylpyrimidine kinase/phosphomethylpyrimidine kinase
MGNRKNPPVILAFGGYDPTGGAGVLMDAKAVRAAGGYATAVPSCLALQSTAAFSRVVPLPRDVIEEALSCAAKSFRVRALKIGMVGTRTAAEAILVFAGENPRLPVILDPVFRSSSGGALLSRDALPAFRRLLCRASVLTPNLPEIEKILDRRVGSFGEAIVAARDLSFATGAAVVLKGGHFPWKGKRGIDIVFEKRRVTLLGPGARPRRADAHGTGCALASAIAARLAAEDPLVEAARTAKILVEGMIASGFSSAEGRWTLFG